MLPLLFAASAADLSPEFIDVTQALPSDVTFFAQTLTSMAEGPSDTTAFGAKRYGVFLLPHSLVIHEQGPTQPTSVPGPKQPTTERQVVILRSEIEAFPLLEGCLVVVRKGATAEKACLDAVKRFPEKVNAALAGWMKPDLTGPVPE